MTIEPASLDPAIAEKATSRLIKMSNKYDATLAELLDWYSDPLDMESIATWTREQVESSIKFYIWARTHDPKIRNRARWINTRAAYDRDQIRVKHGEEQAKRRFH